MDGRGRDRAARHPRLGLAVGTPEGGFTALPVPPPVPVPFADKLGPIRDGMRAAVHGGTAASLSTVPLDPGAKTGTAQDGGLPDGEYDNWMSAVAPIDNPEIEMTAWVQGPGTGGNSATSVVADGLRHYLGYRADVVATGAAQAP